MDIYIKEYKVLLPEIDIIVWKHPFYPRNAPAILKQQIGLALKYNFTCKKMPMPLSIRSKERPKDLNLHKHGSNP
jgi:putative NADPH-quinone reductase